jgi:hypothetical protein
MEYWKIMQNRKFVLLASFDCLSKRTDLECLSSKIRTFERRKCNLAETFHLKKP